MLVKIDEFGYLLLAFCLFPLLARPLLKSASGPKWPILAGVSVFSSLMLAFSMGYKHHVLEGPAKFFIYASTIFAVYIALVLFSFATLSFAHRSDRNWAAAYASPIFSLLLARDLIPFLTHSQKNGSITFIFVGISYVAFRLCFMVTEVRNKVVEMPSLAQYLSFSFFVPLMIVGPISPYGLFIDSAKRAREVQIEHLPNILRMIRGLLKYLLFSTILSEIGYGPAFMRNGHLHSKLDLLVAVLVYPLFLYCNFSGLCDVAIGASSLCGIQVAENFNNPFGSRNFQEFWSKWHISLSTWMRDMVFTPMVKAICTRWPSVSVNNAIAAAIMTVFILIGLWHGVETHFVLFGISQGLGVVAIHYGGVALKAKMSKQQLLAYRQNPRIKIAGRVATYLYFAATLSLFANSTADLAEIMRHIV